MVNKNTRKDSINRKARISRHLRIFKDSIGKTRIEDNDLRIKKSYGYGAVIFSVVILLPLYPNFASSVYGNSRTEFYRGNINEDSIIGSFDGIEDIGELSEDAPVVDTTDSYLSVNTILDDSRDLSGTTEIINYSVKSGDSFYSIAYKFKVSVNSIYWANDFSKNHTLRPGDNIKVPPVSGLIHTIKSGDTLSAIAKKYDIGESKIIEQNGIKVDDSLIAGSVLVIPGAKKIEPKPVPKVVPTKKYTPSTKSSGYSFASQANSQYSANTGKFKLVYRKPFSGAWGNCTWYVASYKNVNWRGNANQWLRNARAKGHKTGNAPTIGAIVSFEGRGYNPRYGHVGIVMDVKSDHIIVSDMNYRRLGEVTYRKVPINDRSITGYIYVN